MPCGVVIESHWLWHKRQTGREGGRKAAGDDYVCGKVNVYTLATHVEPMCLAQKCKLICQSHWRREKKWEGGEREKTCIGRWPTTPIEISHLQTGYSPEAGGFALETVPVAIFGTWPDGGTPEGVTGAERWFRIQPPTHPTASSALPPSLPRTSVTVKPRPLWPNTEDMAITKPCRTHKAGCMYKTHSLESHTGWLSFMSHTKAEPCSVEHEAVENLMLWSSKQRSNSKRFFA